MLPTNSAVSIAADKSELYLRQPRPISPQPAILKPKLEALSSLRFFAAMAIVWFHLLVPLGLWEPAFDGNQMFAQGVSFFFVLSGFILTYQYPRLADANSVKGFLWARFARLWPAHVSAILLGVLLFPLLFWPQVTAKGGTILLSQLAMIHSWIPWRQYFNGLDPVSWSISTEWTFYLCFPLLIKSWPGNWSAKLIFCLVLTAISAFISASVGDTSTYGLINPLTRLFEFVLGMAAGTFWLATNKKIRLNFNSASLAETVFLAFFALVLFFERQFITSYRCEYPIWIAKQWFVVCGNAPLFAVMIYLVAGQRGVISRLLQNPLLVWCGEMSYSIYLFHYFGILFIDLHRSAIAQVNMGLVITIFVFMVLWLAHLNYALTERPGRQWLRSLPDRLLPKRIKTECYKPKWHFLTGKNLALLLQVMAFAISFAAIDTYVRNLEEKKTPYRTANCPEEIHFGQTFTLKRVQVARSETGVKVKLSWKSSSTPKAQYFVAVHLLGPDREILTSCDYMMPGLIGWMINPMSCVDRLVLVPKSSQEVQAIGIAVYKERQSDLLSVDKGVTDWQGHRLILPLVENPGDAPPPLHHP
ncbi:MAG: hypothetical protein C5B53_10480 [Candidatus Melainabacteria bacterium]|nr:MAG: hypothetical protein C5B53_10480 [Candidatus Melainabacteria bacterium]